MELHKNMKHIFLGILSLFLFVPSVLAEEGDVDAAVEEDLRARECVVESFSEEELKTFNNFEDLELLVRWLEYNEPLSKLVGLYKYFLLSDLSLIHI